MNRVDPVAARVTPERVLQYRARVSHLDAKLPAGAFATAAWGGLQDSVPRGGVLSLHARVEDTRPDSWEDPSVVQIWFRGGADYIVPRADVGVFTLGSYPRDAEAGERLERLADDIHRATGGRMMTVREVADRLAGDRNRIRGVAMTGRVLIRWDASNIWLIPVDRPSIDPEDARTELARRFVHWFGPTTKPRLATWTGVTARDATRTWQSIESELTPVETDGVDGTRYLLASDLEAMQSAGPVAGVRLLPYDDPYTKLDTELLVPDADLRRRVFPGLGESKGHIPGAILVDGEVVGSWQRQGRKATLHPWRKLSASARERIEAEALAFPIAGAAAPTVTWDLSGSREGAADAVRPPLKPRSSRSR